MPFDEEKQIQQLIQIYRQGFEEILRIIVEKEAKGQWTQYWRDLLLEVKAILQQLDQYADTWIEQTIGQVYSQAAAETVAFLSGLGIATATNPEFAQIHQRAIDVVVQNMADNLRDATQFIGRRINDVFRRVGLEETGGKLAAGATVRDMKKKVVQRLLNEGQTAFVDKLGRKWRLDTYAEMVARTTTREAASVATLNTCQEFGLDLVRITRHYPTCGRCAAVQNKVFSISGKDSRYPKLTDEYRPPLHPHCRCVLTPYVRELDDNADETERFSNQPLDVDPRSEAEKQAYAEMRDAVMIATNRKRAREAIYSETASLEEKVKAARKLQRTYEKTGTKPAGKDALIIRQYKEFLKTGRYQGKIVLKGKNYSPEYREKLLELDGYFSLHGYQLSEHALNNVLGRINQGRIPSKEAVLELLESPVRFKEPNGILVKFEEGMSAHINPETSVIITIVPRKKPKSDWKVVDND